MIEGFGFIASCLIRFTCIEEIIMQGNIHGVGFSPRKTFLEQGDWYFLGVA